MRSESLYTCQNPITSSDYQTLLYCATITSNDLTNKPSNITTHSSFYYNRHLAAAKTENQPTNESALALSASYGNYITNENISSFMGDFYNTSMSYPSVENVANLSSSLVPQQNYHAQQQYRPNNSNYSLLQTSTFNYYWPSNDVYDGSTQLGAASTTTSEAATNVVAAAAAAVAAVAISDANITTYDNNFQQQLGANTTTMNCWNTPIASMALVNNNSVGNFYDQTFTSHALTNNYSAYKDARKYDYFREQQIRQNFTDEMTNVSYQTTPITSMNLLSITAKSKPLKSSISKLLPKNNEVPEINYKKTTDSEVKLDQTKLKLYPCNICGKQYFRKSTLKTHMKHHVGQRPFSCQICNKSFSQAANLTAHKRVHTGEKPFKCYVCFRPFSQSSSLVTHKRTHTGERPYPCNQCNKAFTDSSTLTKHLRTHTGQKPYSCHLCLMQFSQSGNLHRHMKTHDTVATTLSY